MPVEIRELIIRTTVVNSEEAEAEAEERESTNPQGGYVGDEVIIAACVAQVLKILERKKAR